MKKKITIKSSIKSPFTAKLWSKWIFKKDKDKPNIYCPVCGYYCNGNGGIGCIDKPNLYDKKNNNSVSKG